MAWCHWREPGTDPLESQHSKVLAQTRLGTGSIRGHGNQSLHVGWLAVRLAWLGSTCTTFTTRWTPIVRIQTLPCTSVVPGQAHVLSAFKGIYGRAASVSDERVFTGLHVHRACSTVLSRWRPYRVRSIHQHGASSPMEEVIFISTRHVKLLNFEFRARHQTLTT